MSKIHKFKTFKERNIYLYTYESSIELEKRDIELNDFITVFFDVKKSNINKLHYEILYESGSRYYCSIGEDAQELENLLDSFIVHSHHIGCVTVANQDLKQGLEFALNVAYQSFLNEPLLVICEGKSVEYLVDLIEVMSIKSNNNSNPH